MSTSSKNKKAERTKALCLFAAGAYCKTRSFRPPHQWLACRGYLFYL